MTATRLNPEYQPKGSYAPASHTHPTSQVSGFGTVVTTAPGAVSVATGTWAQLASVTLDAGVWVVQYGCAWASNATGRRMTHLGTSTPGAGRYSPTTMAVSGDQTRMQATGVNSPSSSTVYRLYGQQTSGGALQCYPFISAVRVK